MNEFVVSALTQARAAAECLRYRRSNLMAWAGENRSTGIHRSALFRLAIDRTVIVGGVGSGGRRALWRRAADRQKEAGNHGMEGRKVALPARR